jgi:hypothetical protein
MHGYISEAGEDRTRFLAAQAGWETLQGRFPVVLFSDPADLAGLYREPSFMLAPGKKGHIQADPILEFVMAETLHSPVQVGTAVASAMITDGEIRAVRDPFWHYSARGLISALVRISADLWTAHQGIKDPNSRRGVSFSRTFVDLFRDLQAARFGNVKEPAAALPWWGEIRPDLQRILQSLVLSNATPTAGSIFSETEAYMQQALAAAPETACPALFSEIDRPLFVHLGSWTPKALFFLLSALQATKGAFPLLAVDVDRWNAHQRRLLGGFCDNFPEQENSVWWTSSLPVREEAFSRDGDLWWGAAQNPAVLAAFRAAVQESTGSESGLLTHLPAEHPGQLKPGQALLLSQGRWTLVEARSALRPLVFDEAPCPLPLLEPDTASFGGGMALTRDIIRLALREDLEIGTDLAEEEAGLFSEESAEEILDEMTRFPGPGPRAKGSCGTTEEGDEDAEF